jgi:hypothetical protein
VRYRFFLVGSLGVWFAVASIGPALAYVDWRHSDLAERGCAASSGDEWLGFAWHGRASILAPVTIMAAPVFGSDGPPRVYSADMGP